MDVKLKIRRKNGKTIASATGNTPAKNHALDTAMITILAPPDLCTDVVDQILKEFDQA